MRNKPLCVKAKVWVILVLLQSFLCNAQVINNKINIYAGYNTGSFSGNEMARENSFQYPSLYSNLKKINGISIKVLQEVHPYFSFGMNMLYGKAADWKHDADTDYVGSNLKIKSLSLVFQIHSKFTNIGILSHGRLFFEISPGIGLAGLTLAKPLFDIQNGDTHVSSPMNSSDFYYGLLASAGIEINVTQGFGFYIQYAYSYNQVSSKLYADKQFSNSSLNAGTIFRLKKVKRIY